MSVLPIVVAGTIGTYPDLVEKVAEWLDRDDLNDRIPDFVALCEARLSRELRTLMQETRVTWTISTGSGFQLPSDFRKLRRIWNLTEPAREIREVSPQDAQQFYRTSGSPRAYYIEGRTLYVMPAVAEATNFDATYWTRIPPLSSANTSNWLIDEHPDAYLIGTLLEAAVFIRDDDAVSYLDPRFTDIIAAIKAESRTDQYGGGPIVPVGPKQVRGARC